MQITIANLMRPNAGTILRNRFFIDKLRESNADIIILTETNSVIGPERDYHSLSSASLYQVPGEIDYKERECRVSIFSKYPFIRQLPTQDPTMTVCGEVQTPFGALVIYGTVIGDLGGKGGSFKNDLDVQFAELEQLAKQNNVLFAGDLNISFSGYIYPSREEVNRTKAMFEKLSLSNLTHDLANNAIHCLISDGFLTQRRISITREMFDKKITDHGFIHVTIE